MGRYRKLLSEGLSLTDVIGEWLTTRRLRAFFVALLVVLVLGTLFYWLVADLSFVDAAYQAVITASTVGYGDEAHDAGPGVKAFTTIYVAIAVLVFSVTMSRIAAALVESRIRIAFGRRRMEQRINELKDHIILCGYGRFGQITAGDIRQADIPLVIIDADPAAVESAEAHDILGVIADATEEETLIKAGLDRARALLCSLPSDADNVYTILTARDIRPDIPIVALARDRNAERKIVAAGATNVISPYEIGAAHMARMILSPNVAQVVQLATGAGIGIGRVTESSVGVRMEEITIGVGSILDGVALKDSPIRTDFGVIVVAVMGDGGKRHFNPDPSIVLAAGNVLVSVGPEEGLSKLRAAVS